MLPNQLSLNFKAKGYVQYLCQAKSIDIHILSYLLYLQMVTQYAEPIDLPEVQVIQGNIHL